MFDQLLSSRQAKGIAEAKQKAVYDLMQQQLDVWAIVTRGVRGGAINPTEGEQWQAEINACRQKWQDEFLLVTKHEEVNHKVAEVQQRFGTRLSTMRKYVEESERAMVPEERLQSINRSFDHDLAAAKTESLLDLGTERLLRKRIEQYGVALKRNIESEQLRSDVRQKLVHHLIDGYYEEVDQTFQQAFANRKRLR